MGILVRAVRKRSVIPGAGQGLFAEEVVSRAKLVAILEGALIMEPYFQIECGKGNELIRKSGIRYYKSEFMVAGDEREYADTARINHSFEPNLLFFLGNLFALRDVAVGDELTLDYELWLADKKSDGSELVAFIDPVTNRPVRGKPPLQQLMEQHEAFAKMMGFKN